MKKIFLIIFAVLVPFMVQQSTAQLRDNYQEIQELKQKIDELESQVLFQGFYGKYNYYCSQLALILNRNFTYFGYLHFIDTEEMSDGKYKVIYQFSGYQSIDDFNNRLKNHSNFISAIRENLISIRRIIVDNDEFWNEGKHRNRLIIKYFDNNGASEPFITADTELNSLKVRINGVLTEVGWE